MSQGVIFRLTFLHLQSAATCETVFNNQRHVHGAGSYGPGLECGMVGLSNPRTVLDFWVTTKGTTMLIKSFIKRLLIITPLASLALFLMFTTAFSMTESALIKQLEGLNAHQALALANQWHWEKQPVRTHFTSKEIVFQFESGKVKKIALPEDEMMVAVAPFINRTHK